MGKRKNITSNIEKIKELKKILWSWWNWWENKEGKFKIKWRDLRLYKSLIKKFWNNKLMIFDSFVEKVLTILINNKFKNWYTIKKALAQLWSWNQKIYKQLWFINNIKILNNFFEYYPLYKKYNFLFENVWIWKSIHNLEIIKQMRDIEKKEIEITYKSLRWFNWIFSNLFQLVL